jgi:hypothetical protein
MKTYTRKPDAPKSIKKQITVTTRDGWLYVGKTPIKASFLRKYYH